MKTKNESSVSLAKLSEPWRNTEKGGLAENKRNRAEPESKFRIAGYVRLSPTGDEREEGSLVSHPQRIKQFVESKNIQSGGNWGEIVDWYVDKDLSGKDMNRPSFQRLLTDIKGGRINAVIVTELSRLNRRVKDFCEVWDFFKVHGATLFSLKENFDTSTPMGELMLIQAMSFSQFERQTIVERVKRGARARAERGLANGTVLLGFKLVERRPNYREVDETERDYVEFIFKKFLELKKISNLVEYLNQNGFRTKEFTSKNGKKIGGNRWSLSSVHALLTNRSYIAEREVNKSSRSLDVNKLREEDRYFCVKAHWPELVSRDLFFDVQRLLEGNKKKARKYVHEYRLTGLIECAECGSSLVGKSGTGRSGKYFYYGHKRKMLIAGDRHLKRCKYENLPAPILEEAIIARMMDLSNDRELIAELIRQTTTKSAESNGHKKALIATKEQERRKLEQKVRNLCEAMADEDDRGVRSGLSDMAKEIKTKLDQVTLVLQELRHDFEQTGNVVDISEAMKFVQIFRKGAFEAQPVSVQAEILKDRIRRIVVRENGVCVEIFGQSPECVLDSLDEKSHCPPNIGNPVRSNVSGVLTEFKVARPPGVEPGTLRSEV